jgi:hypothetical protein
MVNKNQFKKSINWKSVTISRKEIGKIINLINNSLG